MQTNGVFCPIMEVYRKYFGPWNAGPYWLSGACAHALTGVFPGPPILTFRFIFQDIWQALIVGAWWISGRTLHGIRLKQNILRKGGDLGIEPRSHWLHDTSLTNQPSAFVCNINGTWFIWERTSSIGKHKRKCANIWMALSGWDTSASSPPCLCFCLKNTSNSGGFEPPQSETTKIANRNWPMINWARWVF